jgi:hypothetical protein
MGLLQDVIGASGGIGQWRQLQRFTVHMAIDGGLLAGKGKGGLLRNVVAEGDTRRQSVQISGFTAPDKYGLYRPDRVAVEASDGTVLAERSDPRSAFAGHNQTTPWDDLHLAYYCGCWCWNALTAPFLFADSDFHIEEMSPWRADGETWRRLSVEIPSRIASHCPRQTIYIDRHSHQRRIDYEAAVSGGTPIAQYSWAHQAFSGIVVPTLYRAVTVATDGAVNPGPAALEVEIFDARFE